MRALLTEEALDEEKGYPVVWGRFWQRGQKKDERFMKCSRLIGVPHRSHGCPSRPYACSDREK